MTAITIQLSDEVTTVACDACGHSETRPTRDRTQLLTAFSEFLHAHGQCLQLSRARTP
ncbi:MAG: hypothetical protein QOE05_1387 [Actinomycetota bacterium]|jgi:hypothetical protein|nr:hypothetical protein [Actinomycetota bacterium]